MLLTSTVVPLLETEPSDDLNQVQVSPSGVVNVALFMPVHPLNAYLPIVNEFNPVGTFTLTVVSVEMFANAE